MFNCAQSIKLEVKMSHHPAKTEQDNRFVLESISELLESTGSDIGRLSTTCCQPEKSERMQALLREFKQVGQPYECVSYGDKLIEFAEKTGSIIGGMHVTCCSPDREQIYQNLLKHINQLFLLAWRLKGVAHE